VTRRRLTGVRVGDVVEADEQHYCYGLGRLTLRVIEVGRRERHSDGVWLNLRGVELGRPGGPRQRRVLVRLAAIRVRSGRPAGPTTPGPGAAHVPVRPDWLCAGCRVAWPCPDRRARLLVEYASDRTALAVYLGCHLADAASDLPALPGELYSRFLGWLPDRPPP
jgi:hypothetical protein